MPGSDLVWYAAYGSNLHLPRFTCYLEGGCPPGSARTYTGCRDATPPRGTVDLWLPGRLRFGGDSPVWGGGVAVLEHADQGAASRAEDRRVAATAYLLTREQVCDVVAQETRQECGAVHDLDTAVGGSGWYDVMLRLEHQDRPLYALAAQHPPARNTPSPAYLETMTRGLVATRGWSEERCRTYLAPLLAGGGPAR